MVTIAVELHCGSAVLPGAFVAIVSVPMVLVLLVAMFGVRLGTDFHSKKRPPLSS